MNDISTRLFTEPLTTRFAASTANEEARTVELVWTTGARVMRRDHSTGERYAEDLSLATGHVDLGRLNAGAPLLDSHSQGDLRSVLGVVERAWIANGEGRALVRFSERADVEPIWRDVKSGILRNVSVGYAVRQFQIDRESEDFPIYRAVDWEPMELSMVAIPADAGAGTRAAPVAVNADTPETQRALPEEDAMDNQVQDAGTEPVEIENTETVTETNEAEVRSAPALDRDAIVAAERSRVTEITAIAARHDVPADFVARHVEAGSDPTQFSAAVLEMRAARSEAIVINTRHNDSSLDNPVARRSALEGALHAAVTRTAPQGAAAHFGPLGFVDLARELTGETRGPVGALMERAMAQTSDFPLILANVGNKVMLDTYTMASPSYREWSMQTTFNDFKSHSMVSLGEFPDLSVKTETGDYDEGTIGEKGESITPNEYGRIYHISRRALINDDLGAFNVMAGRAGRRAANKENALVYGVLAANPVMSDTLALFHATHNNLAAAATTIANGVAAAKAAMRKQTSVGGMPLNIQPAILLVGADMEEFAYKLVSPIVPNLQANVNNFVGALRVVVDPMITGTTWYLFADPASDPVMAWGFVSGGAGPTFALDRRFESDSLRFRMQLDFGAGVVDYRGGYRNAGLVG
jgi:hypothetical protein